jgi:hypothetical protein
VDFIPALRGDFVLSAILAEQDGLAHVVHHHLAGLALRQMLLELLAERSGFIALNILIQGGQDFFAIHGSHRL